MENALKKKYSAVYIAHRGKENTEEYKKRRQKFLSKLKNPVVLAGIPREPGSEVEHTSIWNRLVQTPAFLYLTGINQSGCFLLLNPLAHEKEKEILFLPQKDEFKEFWNGIQLGIPENGDISEIVELTGISNICDCSLFENVLEECLAEEKVASLGLIYSDDFKGDPQYLFYKKMSFLAKVSGKSTENVTKFHVMDRLVLSKFQQEDLKKAVSFTEHGFRQCLSKWHEFKTERDLSLYLDYEMQKESQSDLAFPTITANGENACCLHYVKNDEILEQGKLVLLDFGSRSGVVCSDISRTVPVSGKFSPLQRVLYNAVLSTQEFYESIVTPGKTLKELNEKAWDFLNEKLKEICEKYEGSMELLYDKAPHGISHFIGEQVHECGIFPNADLKEIPLEPGMLISNEPGVYGKFSLKINGICYEEKLGIRIEDDLLVTSFGCKNVSQSIPKKVEDLESVLKR